MTAEWKWHCCKLEWLFQIATDSNVFFNNSTTKKNKYSIKKQNKPKQILVGTYNIKEK